MKTPRRSTRKILCFNFCFLRFDFILSNLRHFKDKRGAGKKIKLNPKPKKESKQPREIIYKEPGSTALFRDSKYFIGEKRRTHLFHTLWRCNKKRNTHAIAICALVSTLYDSFERKNKMKIMHNDKKRKIVWNFPKVT